MSPAPEAGALVDPASVRAFVGMAHAAAARALEGTDRKGVLQLGFLGASGLGDMHFSRYEIGDAERMAAQAISAAEQGLNVFIEPRTIEAHAPKRGAASATLGVWAVVDDADNDKGKGGSLPLAPTWTVESSPGNYHRWLVLDRALASDEAKAIGRAMRAVVKSDSATGKPEQPFRVAGCPNFPDAKKRARGRVPSPTRILSTDGPTYTAAALAEAFPPVEEPDAEASALSAGRSGATSESFEDLIAEEGKDRSTRFHEAVRVAFRAGLLRGDIEAAMRAHPLGCSSKYLRPTDRLAEEIARSWAKVEARAGAQAEAEAAGVEPTFPDQSVPVAEARAALQAAVDAHFAAGAGHRAARVGTGCGKTRAAVKAIAADIRRRRAEGDRSAALYLTPILALADEVGEVFRAEGVTARTFRGRTQPDPEMADSGRAMCWDPEGVDLALRLDLTVSTACCRLKDRDTGQIHLCPHFSDCGYQRQVAETVDVWCGAHDLAFSAPAGLGEVGSVTIDEGFAQGGLRIATRGTTLDELGASPGLGKNAFEMMAAADVAAWRSQLVAALRRQESPGGVARRHLIEGGITVEMCNSANAAEWRMRDRVNFYPGMPRETRQAAARAAVATGKIGKASAVWRAARDLLEQEDEGAVSGRLVLVDKDAEDGFGKVRGVLVHGIRKVMKRWLDLPILLLDATLPPVEMLRAFLPDVEVVADIEAATPHARVRQVVGAPTAKGKLHGPRPGPSNDGEGKAKRALQAVRRAVLLRWARAGRPRTLVTAQKDTVAALRELGMPDAIALGHYGALSGLDGFKDVGLLIAIGRAMPDPLKVETMAGALTGLEPLRAARPDKGAFFHERVPLALRMADGTGRAVEGYRHPDPIAEAFRWQSAEGGVLQAVGRARAVNRMAANPIEIEVWSDLALPLTVDEVVAWDDVPAGYEADMVIDGVVLESPSDLSACWPGVWETAQAARRWQQKTTGAPNPIEDILYKDWGACGPQDRRRAAFRYQHRGERQKWRRGWHLPNVVPDPRAWLEARLGALAGFEVVDRG